MITGAFERMLYRPRLDVLEARCLPSVLTVSNSHDAGLGSLRAEIVAAHAGDTIVFAHKLTGATITLKTELTIDKALSIQGLGAGNLAISGNNVSRIFNIEAGAESVTITGLALRKGLATEGGAILDDGASLALKSDTLNNNHAIGAADGLGGALAVLGGSTAGMTVTVSHCKFSNDTALGALGTATSDGGIGRGGAVLVDAQSCAGLSLSVTGTSFTGDFATGGSGFDGIALVGESPTAGGLAEGGAVWLWADAASQPTFSFATDTFSNCSATGGRGGNGDSANDGQNGGNAGIADGGALYWHGGLSPAPVLNVTSCIFTSNMAIGGSGGGGGDSTSRGNGGAGGSGGAATGGAVFVDFWNSVIGSVNFSSDSFNANTAKGSDGGAGGNGSFGGSGGYGGAASGGGLAVGIGFYFGSFAAGTQLEISQSLLLYNTAQSGNGGNGGNGGAGLQGVGGTGGAGNVAVGGGLALYSTNSGSYDTWVLYGNIFSHNQAIAGNGGAGGGGFTAGYGGDAGFYSFGGAIADEFGGTLLIYHGLHVHNSAVDGTPGSGSYPGIDGSSYGGGIAIVVGTALATPDRVFGSNSADNGADISGILGTL